MVDVPCCGFKHFDPRFCWPLVAPWPGSVESQQRANCWEAAKRQMPLGLMVYTPTPISQLFVSRVDDWIASALTKQFNNNVELFGPKIGKLLFWAQNSAQIIHESKRDTGKRLTYIHPERRGSSRPQGAVAWSRNGFLWAKKLLLLQQWASGLQNVKMMMSSQNSWTNLESTSICYCYIQKWSTSDSTLAHQKFAKKILSDVRATRIRWTSTRLKQSPGGTSGSWRHRRKETMAKLPFLERNCGQFQNCFVFAFSKVKFCTSSHINMNFNISMSGDGFVLVNRLSVVTSCRLHPRQSDRGIRLPNRWTKHTGQLKSV